MKLSEIAEALGGTLQGDPNVEITHLAKVHEADPGSISFIDNPYYKKFLDTTKASAVIVRSEMSHPKLNLVVVENPRMSFFRLLRFFLPPPQYEKGIHPTAVVGKDTKIGENVGVGAYTVIGKNSEIGEGSQIFPLCWISDRVKIGKNVLIYGNVSIREETEIGDNCIIHSGVVIGADGFGFVKLKDGTYEKILQVGKVVIEKDVEIGANTCIDRAAMGETRVHRGVKFDNLVQIAHNTDIGEDTVMAAMSGVAGSCTVGKNCVFAGQVGILGHINVGDNVTLGGQAGVIADLPGNQFYSGYPAKPHVESMRELVSLRHLPELLKEFKKLKKELEELKAKLK